MVKGTVECSGGCGATAPARGYEGEALLPDAPWSFSPEEGWASYCPNCPPQKQLVPSLLEAEFLQRVLRNEWDKIQVVASEVTRVVRACRALSPREVRVLFLRLIDLKELEEVGTVIGVTREWVRRIEVKALRKLRYGRNSRLAATAGPTAAKAEK